MLTLDTEQVARQRRQEELLRRKDSSQTAARDHIAEKARSIVADGDLQVTLLAQQMGSPMASVELERRLRLINSRLIFEVSIRYPDRMGIYIDVPEKRLVVAYTIGVLPERDVRHAKKVKVPDPVTRGQWVEVDEITGLTRGWRTVLLRLLTERLITRFHVEHYFPANAASKNWHTLVD